MKNMNKENNWLEHEMWVILNHVVKTETDNYFDVLHKKGFKVSEDHIYRVAERLLEKLALPAADYVWPKKASRVAGVNLWFVRGLPESVQDRVFFTRDEAEACAKDHFADESPVQRYMRVYHRWFVDKEVAAAKPAPKKSAPKKPAKDVCKTPLALYSSVTKGLEELRKLNISKTTKREV